MQDEVRRETKTAQKPGRTRSRTPDQTREALLRAAVEEFAREGYGGARVDRISRAAASNDRMLYYYFSSKEQLFHNVIERCYADLVAEEEALALDLSSPTDALEVLIEFNWNYYWRHPELLSILGSENLFEGRHVKNNIKGAFSKAQLSLLDRILAAGANAGLFQARLRSLPRLHDDHVLTYFYRSNLYTLTNYLGIDLANPDLRASWLAHVQKIVLALVRDQA